MTPKTPKNPFPKQEATTRRRKEIPPTSSTPTCKLHNEKPLQFPKSGLPFIVLNLKFHE
jgi:hypothetical protein